MHAGRMLQDLPKTQTEVFEKASSALGRAASAAHVSRQQHFQMQLALATDTEDSEAMAMALTTLLQDLYTNSLNKVPLHLAILLLASMTLVHQANANTVAAGQLMSLIASMLHLLKQSASSLSSASYNAG